MLRVGCKDIGIDDCEFVAEGEKVRKVEDAMILHLRDVHPHVISGLTDVQHRDLETRIKSGMHGLPPEAAPHEHDKRHKHDKHATLRVSCADLGITGCDFVAEERKVRKVEERFFDHLRDLHPEVLTGLTSDQHAELEHKVKEAIRPE
jgi:predicted small metal-binding protein